MEHKMKILISHDVDHLTVAEHFFRDLIIPKMLVRSFLHLLSGKINAKTFLNRLGIVFKKNMNEIENVMKFDLSNGIPSVFFFGMNNGLGMSYKKEKVLPYIELLNNHGFDIGVHGVEYQDYNIMKKEYESFHQMSNMEFFGIRNHYVRYDSNTFKKMSDIGYIFDSSWYNKEFLEFKAPYKIGNMWEFPLHIMDVYICKPGQMNQGIEDTKKAIMKAELMNMPYCTILFHDYQFENKGNPDMKEWYIQTVEYLKKNNYEFISYRDAIEELELIYANDIVCK